MPRLKTQEAYISVPEGKIHTRTWTPETPAFPIPLILLHDSPGCVDLWKNFPQMLSRKLSRPVIAYDRLGFGNSEARADLASINFIKEEATQYFPHLKNHFWIKHYLLMGHSVSGGMSLNIAAGGRRHTKSHRRK